MHGWTLKDTTGSTPEKDQRPLPSSSCCSRPEGGVRLIELNVIVAGGKRKLHRRGMYCKRQEVGWLVIYRGGLKELTHGYVNIVFHLHVAAGDKFTQHGVHRIAHLDML